jgi:hypothetical protein
MKKKNLALCVLLNNLSAGPSKPAERQSPLARKTSKSSLIRSEQQPDAGITAKVTAYYALSHSLALAQGKQHVSLSVFRI